MSLANPFNRSSMRVLLIGIIACTAAVAIAAPIRPSKPKLPPEVIGLAGIEEVRVQVDPIPLAAKNAGIDQELLTVAFREEVERVGLKVVEREDVPKVVFQVMAPTHADHEDVIGVMTIVAVHQPVTIERTGKSLTVPTASMTRASISSVDRARFELDREVRSIAQFLATLIKQATVEAEN